MAIQPGLYKVQFQTPLGAGFGVAYLAGGNIHGGDGGMAYSGKYTEAGDTFSANVHAFRHSYIPGMTSVFGKDDVHIDLAGKSASPTSASLHGKAVEAPGVAFTAILTRIAD